MRKNVRMNREIQLSTFGISLSKHKSAINFDGVSRAEMEKDNEQYVKNMLKLI